MNKNNKKGQVWIETVIYILIGLSLIGLVLAYVLPKINEQKDRSLIEQTIVSLSSFDDKVLEVNDRGEDNKRIVEFTMRSGELSIIPEKNQIVFSIDGLTKPYSEPDVSIPVGRVIVKTSELRKTSSVNLTLDYNKLKVKLSFNNMAETKKFTRSSTPYQFSIENKGIVLDISGEKKQQIDFNLIG